MKRTWRQMWPFIKVICKKKNKSKTFIEKALYIKMQYLIIIKDKKNTFSSIRKKNDRWKILFEIILLESKILFLSCFNQRFIGAIQMFICLCALHMIVFNFIILEHFQFSNVLIIGSLQHNCSHKSNLFSQHGIFFLFYHYLYFFR